MKRVFVCILLRKCYFSVSSYLHPALQKTGQQQQNKTNIEQIPVSLKQWHSILTQQTMHM